METSSHLPEPPGFLAHLYPRHSRRYTYKRLHECNLNFSVCVCDCVCFFVFFSLCYKTRDGTWDYYISIVFVITRKGSQYFCLLFGVCETSGYWMFTCCVWGFLWFYLYIFDFSTILENLDCNAYTSESFLRVCVRHTLIMNVLELGSTLVISLSDQITTSCFDLCGVLRLRTYLLSV